MHTPEAPPPRKSSGALQKGGSTPFPRTHRGSGKTPQRDPEARIRPARGVPRAGRTARASSKPKDRRREGQTKDTRNPTFPWMQDIPERLRLRLRWTPRPAPESSKPSLILLYAGKDDAGALDAYLHAYNPAFSEYIWAVDIRRKGGDLGQDMLEDEPYSTMCSMAMAGKVAFVGGGPNCRTRGASSDGSRGPAAGEGQSGADPWGLEDLEPRVMEDTDNDSVLMLRQMYLTSLAYKGLGQLTVPQVGSSFLEHPMDPMECSKSPSAARCSSIWVTRAYIQWANALHSLIKFDECRLGQVVVKSTTLSTDLPLHH